MVSKLCRCKFLVLIGCKCGGICQSTPGPTCEGVHCGSNGPKDCK